MMHGAHEASKGSSCHGPQYDKFSLINRQDNLYKKKEHEIKQR